MNFKEVEAMWIAAIYMAYGIFKKGSFTIDDLYFKQADIVKTAKQMLDKDIKQPLLSQHCNADHPNHFYNYLKSDGANRRLVYYGEFKNSKEYPQFSTEIINNTILDGIRINQLIEFWKNEYTKFIVESSLDLTNVIDFKGILDYINDYGGMSYKSPEKIDNPEEKKYMQDLKQKATDISNEFKLIAQRCIKSNSRFIIDTPSKWTDGSNIYLRKYLWIELKKPNRKDSPISVSLSAEKYNEKPRFRISIEIRDTKSNDEDYKKLHKYLLINTLKEDKFEYFGILDKDYQDIPSTEVDDFINKINNGTALKILIGRTITYDEVIKLSQSDILGKIMNYVNQLEKYYDKAVDIDNSEESKISENSEKQEGENTMTQDIKLINDKNIILYGPPGTGKTYNTVIYAVAIIEKKPVSTIKEENYVDVLERYRAYKMSRQIAFTTFHQSYGYEEFIEGIKPVLDSNNDNDDNSSNIKYKLDDGIFKEFCDNSMSKDIVVNGTELNGDVTVWKISLQGARENVIKTECFECGEIRIGWDDNDEIITEKSSFNSSLERNTLLCFQNEMQIGDIVLSLYDQKHIDGIGIIDGDYEFDNNLNSYKRKRKIKWLVTNVIEDIYEINGNTNLTLKTVYRLDRIKPHDLIPIINKHMNIANENEQKNDKNYVFIIDEINRGNISKIFGELITLIETSKRLGEVEEVKAKLPYSKKDFGIPNNVYILGTMNTADRSIALLDTALRRRFTFIEMLPDVNVLDNKFIEGIDIKKVLETINKRIEVLYDREHTIGHAYFVGLKNDDSLDKLAGIFKNSIIPLLQEYFYEDYYKIQLVLGDNDKEDDMYKFIISRNVNKNLFKKNIDFDLPEVIYSINDEAFGYVESYLQIYS